MLRYFTKKYLVHIIITGQAKNKDTRECREHLWMWRRKNMSFYLDTSNTGLSPASILEMISALNNNVHSLHQIAVVKGRKLICKANWAPFCSELPHEVHSLAKSLNSIAVGYAITEKGLKLSDRSYELLKGKIDLGHAEGVERITVEDHLTMRAGGAATSTCFIGVPSNWIDRYYFFPVPAELQRRRRTCFRRRGL